MFISSSNEKNVDPININNVESLSKGNRGNKHAIQFGMVSGLAKYWVYDGFEERNREYQRILNKFGDVEPVKGVLNEG